MTDGRIHPFGESLWLFDGPVVRAYGFSFTTRMAVARLQSGVLWVWSPIRLDEWLRSGLARLGEPRYVVEPNKLHHLALAEWVRVWPTLELYAPPGLARKRRDLHFTGELGDTPRSQWQAEIDQVRVDGSFAITELLFFHRPSRTCLIGDLIEKHDDSRVTSWRRWLMRAGGVAGPSGSTARLWRWSFFDRRHARKAIARAIAWAPQRIVIAHGECTTENGADELRRSFRWLGAG